MIEFINLKNRKMKYFLIYRININISLNFYISSFILLFASANGKLDGILLFFYLKSIK